MKKLRVFPLIAVCFLVMLCSFVAADPIFLWFCVLFPVPIATLCTLLSYAQLPSEWGQPRKESRETRLRVINITVTCLTLIVTTVWFEWPLRLSLGLSTPFLLSLARSAQTQGEDTKPQQALFFTVQRATVERGVACLWLQLPDCEAGDCGYTLLAEGPTTEVQRAFPSQYIHVLSNQWSLIRVSD